jgi:hypothetical protein
MVVYNTWDYCVCGLCPLPVFQRAPKNILETGSVSVPTLLGPLERANFNDWTLCCLEYQTLGKVQKLSNLEPYI